LKAALRDAPIGRTAPICFTWAETRRKEKMVMLLRFAFAFLVIALIAALFGFTNIAAAAVGIAKILFFIFLALFVVLLLFALIFRP
jgi:uncharacterized membrane protein YtjA (UPF0391 family)